MTTSHNIQADPRVRVQLRGKWRSGTAPQARLRELPQFNSFGVRTFGTNLLTARVDFDC